MHSTSIIVEANINFRNKKYNEAIKLYKEAILELPEFSKHINFNIEMAKRKLGDKKNTINQQFIPNVINENEIENDLIKLVNENISSCSLVTFDIWDTVLRRDCEPDEIKLRTARVLWLLESKNNQEKFNTPIKIFQLRKDAERNVADENYEYKFDVAIKEWLNLFGINNEDKFEILIKKLLRCEINAEQKSTKVDIKILNLLNQISNKRRVAISDFYHSSKNLNSILKHHSIENIFDQIYVSCDWMKTKRAGSLYDVVLREEKTQPIQVIHVGDNPRVDIEKANEKGIKAVLYSNATENEKNENLNKIFKAYLNGEIKFHYENIFNILEYDDIVNASGKMSEILEISKFGKLISPLVVGFVLSSMQEAIHHKSDRIFFFAREGIFFRKIYEKLVVLDVFDLGEYPIPETLFVSRRATFCASLSEISIDQMMRMWNMYSVQSISSMAISLNLDVNEISKIAIEHGIDPNRSIKYPWEDALFKKFFNSSNFQSAALFSLKNQKRKLIKHLENSNFKPYEDIDRVIVDIGWRGTIQDNLSYLVNGRTHGVYLSLKNYLNKQPHNSTKIGYLANENIGKYFDIGEVAALEFIFNSQGGSVIGYDDDGIPNREIFEGEERIILNQVKLLQSGILDGVEILGKYINRHGLIADDLISLSQHLTSCYLNSPPSCVADAFLNLEHNETFGSGKLDLIKNNYEQNTLSELKSAELHSNLTNVLKQQRWPSSILNSTLFNNLFSSLTPTQLLNIPSIEKSKNIFSIIRHSSLSDKISIFTPPPIAGSGGHRTIYNLAKGLSREGFDVHLMLENVNNDLWYVEEQLQGKNITLHKEWYAGIQPSVAIATIAHSANYVKNFFPKSLGAYFVQDYEAEFNPLSDGYIRDQNSYASGLAPICIGHWLPHILKKQFGVRSAYGGLGVDTSIYHRLEGVKKKDTVAFLYQPEKWRRMPETCIAALSIVKQMRPQTEIVLYGSNIQTNLPFEADQRGLIHDLSELNYLYNEASVGLCLSLTNPSRIPIEYMAAGCVPVDLYRYNNLFDNTNGASLLAYQSPRSIAEAVIFLLDNKEECNLRSGNCIEIAKKRTIQWEVDTAVNSINYLLSHNTFEKLELPDRTYHQNPVISNYDLNSHVINFNNWQTELSL
jgi:predicted HAD superfamily hydrolase